MRERGHDCMRGHASASITDMPTTKPSPKSLLVRVPYPLVDRIDALRGLVPRERYIRHLLEQAITAEERKAKKGGGR